jgi:hypothetical protein
LWSDAERKAVMAKCFFAFEILSFHLLLPMLDFVSGLTEFAPVLVHHGKNIRKTKT